ncbi:hypothetical protein SAMN02745227_01596 [Anaerobranca californiensis DSM 14826]|jgi:hypothetical protein|uniref:Uncharacterized protein n=1 Tax=Anaerobranca californiensis DSM 14826 TaxID=1120989 RepID=A0A1M6PYD2_9FIRM|nr:hypothetical protein [Anaerobranca californiensis]SHK12897.1 hypothetical protein SAMN02745227_01596 [Anaerobranca californiensis DSM 14826]
MSKKIILKHLWESILIGFVSSMIVTAFFMPYYDIHFRVKTHVNEVLTAFNPIEEIVWEVQLQDAKTRLILFDDIRKTTGTIFSPTLLFSKERNQEETMFFASFDFFMKNSYVVGEQVEIMGLKGLFAGFYYSEHPFGEDFLVVVSDKLENLNYQGEMREFKLQGSYKYPLLPRGFRGLRLLYFLVFCGLLYFVFGFLSIILDTAYDYLKENLLRLSIVSCTIVLCLTTYGLYINTYSIYTIITAGVIAITANTIMVLPLLLFSLGKNFLRRYN